MTKKQKKVLVRIIVAAVLLIILHFVPLEFKLCLEVHILAEWFVLKEYNFIK